jgi:succinyl-diaminopimelate desuccinylase
MKRLLRRLIQAETTVEKGEMAAADIIRDEFGRSGIKCRVDKWDGNRANIIARINSTASRGALLFAGHLDVVPAGAGWKKPAFAAVESGGRIYGRGAADMKGAIASVVTAVKQIVKAGVKLQGDIIFFAAAGEETTSCGAKRFIRSWGSRSPELAGVVIPEPTDFEVVTAHRGLLWVEISTAGRATHGSTPELGVNAIASMKKVLDELENYQIHFKPHKLLGKYSMSVNTIVGGRAMNVVPDKCSIGIDIRTLPAQNHQGIVDDFKEIFGRLKRRDHRFDASVSVVRDVAALETGNKCCFVKDFCSIVGKSKTRAIGFATDGPYFAKMGVPVVVFGPGKPRVCHKPDEYIDICDLEKAVEYYKRIIFSFLT